MSVADGLRALREPTKKPILNESIFYGYEWDLEPLKVEKYKDNSQSVSEFLRENSIASKATDLIGQGETIKLIGVGFILVILINIFKR